MPSRRGRCAGRRQAALAPGGRTPECQRITSRHDLHNALEFLLWSMYSRQETRRREPGGSHGWMDGLSQRDTTLSLPPLRLSKGGEGARQSAAGQPITSLPRGAELALHDLQARPLHLGHQSPIQCQSGRRSTCILSLFLSMHFSYRSSHRRPHALPVHAKSETGSFDIKR